MKKITREETKIIKTDVFVSADGKEFTNETDCKEWERSYKGTLEASIKKLHIMNVCAVDLYLPWSTDDHEVWIIKPQNMNEITLLNAYIEVNTHDHNTLLVAQMIGKEIAIDFGYDREYCDVYVLEDHINDVQKSVQNIIEQFNKQ